MFTCGGLEATHRIYIIDFDVSLRRQTEPETHLFSNVLAYEWFKSLVRLLGCGHVTSEANTALQ